MADDPQASSTTPNAAPEESFRFLIERKKSGQSAPLSWRFWLTFAVSLLGIIATILFGVGAF